MTSVLSTPSVTGRSYSSAGSRSVKRESDVLPRYGYATVAVSISGRTLHWPGSTRAGKPRRAAPAVVRRDGKADPHARARRAADGGVPADDTPARIKQRPARVAGVNGGVRLDNHRVAEGPALAESVVSRLRPSALMMP